MYRKAKILAFVVAVAMVASVFSANAQAAVSEPIDDKSHPPYAPSNPSPSDGATDVDTDVTLSWSGGDADGDTVYYDVYLEAGDSTPDKKIASGITFPSYRVSNLNYDTTYYWKVAASDDDGSVAGPVWSFTTKQNPVATIHVAVYNVSMKDELTDWSNSVTAGMIYALQDTWAINSQRFKFEITQVGYDDVVAGVLNGETDYKL
ncbi:MAG: fibronectin type III domain-containing protein, partial [Thermoplasmatota archaeon]